jgi:hypothetical protein
VGKKGGWKKRWFAIRNNALYYYEDKPKSAGDKPKGVIELSSRSVVRPSAVQRNCELGTEALVPRSSRPLFAD